MNRIHEFCSYDLTPLRTRDINDPHERRRVWDELHLAAALQGLANRRRPTLYLFFVGNNGRVDRFWLRKMLLSDGWLHEWREIKIRGIERLITRFIRFVSGLVVWDEQLPATSNAASTAAGVGLLLPVRYDPAPDSVFRMLRDGFGLPIRRSLLHKKTRADDISAGPETVRFSSKGEVYRWAIEEFLQSGKCVPTELAYYPDAFWLNGEIRTPLESTLVSNHDFFIARKGFFFDLSPWDDDPPRDEPNQPLGEDFRTMKTIYAAAYEQTRGEAMIRTAGFVPWDHKYCDVSGGKHHGVPSEWRFVEIATCHNSYVDADAPSLNAMANASFFQHHPLKRRYLQTNLPNMAALRRRGYLDRHGKPVEKTFVSLYVGDYDASAWLYQMMPTLWEDKARGSIPLGWAFNPNLADRFPLGMVYARQTATPNDTFVAGDSGAGYVQPGYLTEPRRWSCLPSGLRVWEEHCRKYYRKWDIRLTGFVIDGHAPEMSLDCMRAYARFSPGGFVTQYTSTVIPPQGLVNGVPFLRLTCDLNSDVDAAAQQIADSAPRIGFAMYRNVLWSPSKQKALMKRVVRLRPGIEFVEPHTLMILLRQSMTP